MGRDGVRTAVDGGTEAGARVCGSIGLATQPPQCEWQVKKKKSKPVSITNSRLLRTGAIGAIGSPPSAALSGNWGRARAAASVTLGSDSQLSMGGRGAPTRTDEYRDVLAGFLSPYVQGIEQYLDEMVRRHLSLGATEVKDRD